MLYHELTLPQHHTRSSRSRRGPSGSGDASTSSRPHTTTTRDDDDDDDDDDESDDLSSDTMSE
ncbi:hypothetical protein KP509_1Z026800 [Ceratopteris richardii]|nr:hypothetical protein KP509_1Z026800 [Ceratopteris richardii]